MQINNQIYKWIKKINLSNVLNYCTDMSSYVYLLINYIGNRHDDNFISKIVLIILKPEFLEWF